MDIEETIKNCEIYLKQIKKYDPDPFYVNYFFNEYINSVNSIFIGIFEEANRDFGLFISENISENISQKKFNKKAKMKNDQNAMKFSKWYSCKFNQEHENTYPNFIKEICQFKNKFEKLPEIKIMIRASNRYKDDIFQQIKPNLKDGKLRSKEELDIEIKRQLPTFLEIINYKRMKNDEPEIGEKQVIASAFLDIESHNNIEIAYSSEIYILVMKRLIQDSRKKIKELTIWN
ncbi:MAG: hypothetical protein ACE5GR_02810 [Nitrosopumilus sp.]